VAVEAFLTGRIGWLEIAEVVDTVLQSGTNDVDDIVGVLEADRTARARARAAIDAIEKRAAR
jgi:1-deoxy-D-xylulose 5-phosphate reductoisomerase